jgi:hypothetical protein
VEYTVPVSLAVLCVVIVVGMYWGGFAEEKRNAK